MFKYGLSSQYVNQVTKKINNIIKISYKIWITRLRAKGFVLDEIFSYVESGMKYFVKKTTFVIRKVVQKNVTWILQFGKIVIFFLLMRKIDFREFKFAFPGFLSSHMGVIVKIKVNQFFRHFCCHRFSV